jgi:acetoacetate decarboxylase
MKPDPQKLYSMPLIMGAINDQKQTRVVYPHTEVLAFQYLTDFDAALELLPQCFRPARQPIVTVMFAENHGLEFMAGGGYRLASLQISAVFDGDNDHVEGDYILVMFENQPQPIILGREVLGIPKLFAEISPIKPTLDGHLRGEASLWGHLLFGLDVPPLKKQSVLVKAVASRQLNSKPWLGYKYIPSFDGPPDADYPTLTRNDMKLEWLWMGKKANLRFGTARTEDIGVIKNLMDVLATLTILKPLQAVHFTGSIVLRNDLSRRLN